ncbi:MAG: hypothetical protein EAX86_00145 [Candidatus Heimdallarchaeota archaeon]|nr:hypothetical protein [Candidatus Heimdallarchaeota archaeon]
MAKSLYRNIWVSEQTRTVILGVFILSISFLIEIIFLFFSRDIETTFFGFLFLEVDLFGGTFTPLLILFHLFIWGIMFFSTIVVYAIIREYAGGNMNILEIAGLFIVFFISTLLLFDMWFSVFFTAIAGAIVAYLYFTLGND